MWNEFEDEKNYFKNHMLPKIGIYSFIANPNGLRTVTKTVRKNSKQFYSAHKKLNSLIHEINKMGKVVTFDKKLVLKSLENANMAFNHTQGVFKEAEELSDREKSGRTKPGPKPYPKELSKWIVRVIDSAKGNRKKLVILYHFFKPDGEFDRSLDKASSGLWRGWTIEDKISFELSGDEREWVNGFKRKQKDLLARSKQRSLQLCTQEHLRL